MEFLPIGSHRIKIDSSLINTRSFVELIEILRRYENCFIEDLNFYNVYNGSSFMIRTTRTEPIVTKRDLTPEQNDLLYQKINALCNSGHLKPSTSQWCSPVFTRYIANKLELCLDYSALNSITMEDGSFVPNCRDVLNSITPSFYFSRIVLREGFHQLAIEDNSAHKTAFETVFGKFQFTTFHHGMKNAPNYLQSILQLALQSVDQNSIKIYIGRILIHSIDPDSHLDIIQRTLHLLRQANLKIDTQESCFLCRRVYYLGMILDSDGISMDSRKISSFNHPTNRTDLKSFVGLASQYKNFVADFDLIADPLYRLTNPNIDFVWGPAEERAFNSLKNLLVNSYTIPFGNYSGSYSGGFS